MRLKQIKVSGFKSFVDPTTVDVPSQLICVVGPNGCGKSNIIDAVRWVMGESSAKNLRGESMSDVIFNGSNARKPVGKASVELIFDNSEGKAPGPYAQYAEISIRRELSRDGQSDYLLNKTRCRRRDITDLFLGTGLGPRSYSIIEQGMVGRIVEAKPDDLRALVEEAAGISKYKDRRRETETRIRHTREHLARVKDISSELETQLRRLKRQSQAAARYKTLKEEERRLRAQLIALRWRGLDTRIGEQDRKVAGLENEVEAKLAAQRGTEKEMESIRQQQAAAMEHMNKVQAEFYDVGAQIASVEQRIEHARESMQQRKKELERVVQAEQESREHLDTDRKRLQELEHSLAELKPRLEQRLVADQNANATLQAAEQAFQTWQTNWDSFTQEAERPVQEREVQRARISELNRHIEQMVTRHQRLDEELQRLLASLNEADPHGLRTSATERDQQCRDRQTEIEQIEAKVQQHRRQIDETSDALQDLRDHHQENRTRLDSLQELQADALGQGDDSFSIWLKKRGLAGAERLAARLEVEPGWEQAVDRILGSRVGAVCVSDIAAALTSGSVPELDVSLFDTRDAGTTGSSDRGETLIGKIKHSPVDLAPLMSGIHIAEDLNQALAMQAKLKDHETVVTRNACVVGKNWVALANPAGAKTGVLSRESQIEALQAQVASSSGELEKSQQGLAGLQEMLHSEEEQLVDRRRQLNTLTQERGELHNRLGRQEARITELDTRRQQVEQELKEVSSQLQGSEAELNAARDRLTGAERQTDDHQSRRADLLSQRSSLQQAVDQTREQASAARESQHREEIQREKLQSSLDATGESIERLSGQVDSLSTRRGELEISLAQSDKPEESYTVELDALLKNRVEVEGRLKESRQKVSGYDDQLRDRDERRAGEEKAVTEAREVLQSEQVNRQEIVVRRETLEDQLRESGHESVTDLLAELADGASEAAWVEQLEGVERRIQRIGPVNLVAIEEYEEHSERKEYLDKQHDDLSKALATLEEVIRKIDRETRSRFQKTFEALNQRFQEFFPRLFGGGKAYLELTGDDLLETGVTVMARPPGKRNSTIHLLSGGEKALTAVSLLFSFFDLNPAPFCLLDEVDAPLDDANVERYSNVLKTLSERTQLIFITHNKITMEVADHLIGVTMGEPGVSRLVAVDVEQAMQMAAQ